MWEQRLHAWQASGQSAQAWCREHGVSPKTFGYWCRRLSTSPAVSPVLVQSTAPSVTTLAIDASVEITVGPMTVRLPASLSGDALTGWLHALRAC